MAVFFGHRTAEHILNKPYAVNLAPVPDQTLEYCQAGRVDLSRLELPELEGVPRPYDVLVSSRDDRRFWRGMSCHLCQADLPFGSFLELARDVYVASPALCFVQRAQHLSLANTIALGARLCGTYSLDASSPTGIRERKPLVSPEELEHYASLCHGVHGAKRARRAASLVFQGSASPMETITTLVFCLPVRLHGFGLSWPTMNYEVPLRQVAQRLVAKGGIRIDAYWNDFDFGLEYQGLYAHSAPTDIAADISRQLAAESMHIELQPLTIEQLRDSEQRFYLARKIADRIGEQVPADKAFLARNQGLVDDLLYPLEH